MQNHNRYDPQAIATKTAHMRLLIERELSDKPMHQRIRELPPKPPVPKPPTLETWGT